MANPWPIQLQQWGLFILTIFAGVVIVLGFLEELRQKRNNKIQNRKYQAYIEAKNCGFNGTYFQYLKTIGGLQEE